jgi:hypothetical protein
MQTRGRFKNSTTLEERLVAEAKASRRSRQATAGQLAAESPTGRHRSRCGVIDKTRAGPQTADLAK